MQAYSERIWLKCLGGTIVCADDAEFQNPKGKSNSPENPRIANPGSCSMYSTNLSQAEKLGIFRFVYMNCSDRVFYIFGKKQNSVCSVKKEKSFFSDSDVTKLLLNLF